MLLVPRPTVVKRGVVVKELAEVLDLLLPLAFAAAGLPMERISRREAKWHIDLGECNRLQLIEAGLSAQSVSVSDLCTYSHADELFSARRLGTASGRLFTGIMTDKT